MNQHYHSKLYMLSIYCVLLFCHINCSTNTSIRYYKQIIFQHPKQIEFSYPVNKNMANVLPSYWVYSDLQDRIVKIEYHRYGKLASDPITNISQIIIDYSDSLETRQFLDINSNSIFKNQNINKLLFILNDNGHPICQYYQDRFGTNEVDSAGIFLYLFNTDSTGRIIESLGLNSSSEAIIDRYGRYLMRFKYGDINNNLEISNYGPENNLLEDKNGVAIVSSNYDRVSNARITTYYDKYMRITNSSISGIAITEDIYDQKGNISERRYLNKDHILSAGPIERAAIIRTSYAEEGYPNMISYLDSDSSLIKTIEFREDGTYNRIIEYTAANLIVHEQDDNYAYSISECDQYGCVIKKSFYGTDGNLVTLAAGYSYLTNSYDNAGNYFGERYYLASGDLTINREIGAAEFKYVYDGKGKLKELSILDQYGNIVNDVNGVAKCSYTWDKMGNQTEIRFYNSIGELTVPADNSFAIQRDEYSKGGTLKRIKYYSAEDKLIYNPVAGCAIFEAEYDLKGRILRLEYLDVNSNLMMHKKHGLAKIENIYDNDGNLIEMSHYGVDDKLMIKDDVGFASAVRELDECGRLISMEYYGPDENLMMVERSGYAKHVIIYDELDDIARHEYYDENNRLTKTSENEFPNNFGCNDEN